MQRSQARERQIAEHVLGDQGRSEQQDCVGRHDRARERPHRQPSRTDQHERIARAHDQHQRLEGATVQAETHPAQGSRQPSRPAARASGHVLRGCRGSARADHENRREDPQQPERAKGLHYPRGGLCTPPRTCAFRVLAGYPHGWCGGCGGDETHCCVSSAPRVSSAADNLRTYVCLRGALPNGRFPACFGSPTARQHTLYAT